MRLSEWRAHAPRREAVAPKVNAVVDPVLTAFGAGLDPLCWIAWGDDPGTRYSIFAPTPAGLVSCYVRANVPGEGPRAAAKLARWSRVSIGELQAETQSGHRIVSFQLEQLVIRGVDIEADRVASFALDVFAAIDGRPFSTPPPKVRSRSRTTGTKARSGTSSRSTARSSTRSRPPTGDDR